MMADLSGLISSTAAKYNLDPGLVNAVVQQESGGDPSAHNTAGGGTGAWGPMQVRGPALQDYNEAHGTNYTGKDLTDPAKGVDVGAWYLDQQLQKYPNPVAALTAYNQGPNSPAAQQGQSPYAQQVLGRLTNSQATGGSAPQSQSGAPPQNNPAASVLAQFGYGADGTPHAQGAQPASAANAQPDPASDVLAKFGYGADGKPHANAQASTPAPTPAAPAQVAQPAPARSGFGPLPGDQTQNAQESQEAAQQAQTDFGSGLWRGITGTVGGAAQYVAHGAKAAANTLITPSMSELVDPTAGGGLRAMINRGSNWLDQKLTENQAAIPQTPSGSAGEFVGASAPTMALPGGTLMKAVLGGAAAGASQPVTQNADTNFWSQKAVQTGLGAALGGGAHALLSGAGALASKFVPEEDAAITNTRNFLNGQQVEAQPQPDVPGVKPTLAELTGNQNLGVAQRQFAEANPQPFAARGAENDAARQGAFGEAVSTPTEAEMAAQGGAQKAQFQYENSGVNNLAPDQELGEILQRPSMAPVLKRAESIAGESGTNPFEAQRTAAQNGVNDQFTDMQGNQDLLGEFRNYRADAVKDDYQFAEGQQFPVDSDLAKLLQRPSFTRHGVFQRAQNLADEQEAGPLVTMDSEGNPTEISGQALQYLKLGLDDLMSRAKENGIGDNEKRAMYGTQEQLLDWFDNQSPEYGRARANYEQLSQPVNKMEYLQGLNVTDSSGNVNLGKLDTAIKNTEQLRASKRLNMAQSLTDDDMNSLYQMRDNLRAAKSGPDVSKFGPDQIQYVQKALDDEIAKGTYGNAANQNNALTQSRTDLENWLGKKAPGYLSSKQTAAQASNDLETNQYLQKDLTDSMGRLQLNKVEQKVKQIEDAQRLGSDTPAARVTPETLDQLRRIRDSFRVENDAKAKVEGSPTKQNQDARLRLGLTPANPEAGAAQSAIARAGGAAAGAATGWAAGNLVAPGLGGVVGSALGGVVGGALEKRAATRAATLAQSRLADVIDKGTDLFLNPTPELIQKLNNTPGGQRLMQVIDAARQRAPGLAGAVGGGPVFRGATQ